MAIDERLIFYTGKHVKLKALSLQDVGESGWVGWFNDENICTYSQHHYFPNTIKDQQDYLDSCISSSKLQLGIVDKAAPEAICGVVSLSSIDLIHRHAEISGIQAPQTKKNSALFFESWALMMRHGFEQFGLKKIYGGTFHPQVTSALTRVFGFEVEGVRRRHVFKHGTFHDVTLLAVFRDSIQYPEF